ncbi:MAG: RNA polymerase sigma factor RpoD/SigA [Planctomycetia bacterium]|nr:RNA polymerase sigma factor RpoD/SigA [Planctomycetia bacterium]
MKRRKRKPKERRPEPKVGSCMDIYLGSIGNGNLLSQEEEAELARRFREENDLEARDRLIVANLRLVVSLARKYSTKTRALEDLIEEGNLGLIKAAAKYNPQEGTRFSTYASYWIEQSIRRAITTSSKIIRLPAYMVETIGRWRRASAILEEELKRKPMSEEIARRIGFPAKRIAILLKALSVYSVTSPPESSDGMVLEGLVIHAKTKTPDEICIENDTRMEIQESMDRLSQRELDILNLRFGLEDGKIHTLNEVGRRMQVTRERVRQIVADAIAKLMQKTE